MGYFDNKLRLVLDRLYDRFGYHDLIKALSVPKSGYTLQALPFLFEQLIEILNCVLNYVDDIHKKPFLMLPDDHGESLDISNKTRYMAYDINRLSLKRTKAKEKSKRNVTSP